MSNFKKLLITLIIILIVEILFIYTRYKMSQNINKLNINNIDGRYILTICVPVVLRHTEILKND